MFRQYASADHHASQPKEKRYIILLHKCNYQLPLPPRGSEIMQGTSQLQVARMTEDGGPDNQRQQPKQTSAYDCCQQIEVAHYHCVSMICENIKTLPSEIKLI